MNKDEVIPHLKDDFVTWSVRIGFGALSAKMPFLRIPIVKGIVHYFMREAVEKVADAMDLGGYFVYKTVQNKNEAVAYQDSILDYKAALKLGDKDAIAKARAAKNARFDVIARWGNAG